MSKSLSALLVAIAFLLSSVTVISVALAMYALIDDKLLALLFTFAAVLLDIFKYLAWPVAIRVLRGSAAALTIACALMLSIVSGWATYDRLMSSITISKATHTVMTTDRVHDLNDLVKNDSLLISRLDREISDAAIQANDLRARGMISKALELEESVAIRAESQRASAIARMNEGSLEVAHIKSSVAKVASLPAFLAHFLCLGFAISLEIVPALILSSVRSSRRSIPVTVDSEGSVLPSFVIGAPETLKTAETLMDTNAEILETLVSQAKILAPGTPVRLKEFAKNSRIGNLRACEIFKNAEALGAIRKTTVGYVAA